MLNTIHWSVQVPYSRLSSVVSIYHKNAMVGELVLDVGN